MNKFAFVIHTTDLNLFIKAINEPNLTKKRKELIEKVFTWIPPFNISKITGIHSLTGKEIEGFFIYCTLLPEQLLSLDSKFLLKRIVQGGKIAEGLGVKILGLGAYAATVGRKGALVARNLNIPVTTGTCYTIAISMRAILKASDEIGIKLSQAKVCIVGASGGIGSTVANMLINSVAHLVLVGRNHNKLEMLANSLSQQNKRVKIDIRENIKDAVKDSDVVVISTTTPNTLININDLKSGVLVCDVSQPRNVSREAADTRTDVLVIDGGVVEIPGDVNFNFYFGLPPKLAYACIAETMILTLEEMFESYSIGGNVSTAKVLKIDQLGAKHGFKLSRLRSFGQDVTKEQIEKVREAVSMRRKC